MIGFKKLLQQEIQKSEALLMLLDKSKGTSVDGGLRVSCHGAVPQFYRFINGAHQYILSQDEALIAGLAQKDYEAQVKQLVQKRLKQLQRLSNDYEDEEIDNIYRHLHPERQKRVQPVQMTWEQQLASWQAIPYTGRGFAEGSAVILTEKGERVRSKSEKILADYFFRRNIAYKYECPLFLNGYGTIYPDFTFLSKKSGQEVYLEHAGLMDDPGYAEKTVKKINLYMKNNLLPGDRLILTFETAQSVLDLRVVDNLIKQCL